METDTVPGNGRQAGAVASSQAVHHGPDSTTSTVRAWLSTRFAGGDLRNECWLGLWGLIMIRSKILRSWIDRHIMGGTGRTPGGNNGFVVVVLVRTLGRFCLLWLAKNDQLTFVWWAYAVEAGSFDCLSEGSQHVTTRCFKTIMTENTILMFQGQSMPRASQTKAPTENKVQIDGRGYHDL